MGNTLQDQLKKAGLANAKQAAKAKRAQGQKQRDAQRGKHVEDEATRLAREAQEAKVAKDRELNRAAQDAREAREIRAQIRQIVEMNRIAERGGSDFRFTDAAKIRTLHVEEEARDALVKGRLGVVRLDGPNNGSGDGSGGPADEPRYEIVPRAVAKKIAERDAACVVLLNSRETAADDAPAEDDPYAGYEVPDDLMW